MIKNMLSHYSEKSSFHSQSANLYGIILANTNFVAYRFFSDLTELEYKQVAYTVGSASLTYKQVMNDLFNQLANKGITNEFHPDIILVIEYATNSGVYTCRSFYRDVNRIIFNYTDPRYPAFSGMTYVVGTGAYGTATSVSSGTATDISSNPTTNFTFIVYTRSKLTID